MNTFKVKTLVKDISKFYGIPFEEVNAATKTVEQDVRKATMKHGDDKNLFVLTFDDALKYSPTFKEFIDKHPQVADSINTLFKEQRSLGRHAGGVVILDDAPSQMPLITNSGEPQTPWVEGVGQKTLEPLGYIKYDILGLETMRLIGRTIELVLKRKEGLSDPKFSDVREWYDKHLHPDVNDYNDQKVYEYVYHEGRFAGIFQLTSGGAQKLFVAAKPRSIVDIAVLTSIYRPGPLAANVDKLYLKARKGEKYEWGHPLFEKVLGPTNNLLIFQESVMDLAEHVGGFPKDQCDNVRRAIMKRDLSKGDAAKAEAKRLEDDFVAGAVKNGVEELTARKAYQNILWFAGYGFNRAHAIAYAIDSYMCAWLLTHYEEEWLCAYLETMSNNPDDKAKAFGEIRSIGYQVIPIDINHATKTWTILPGKKFMPSLLSVKGVGESAIDELIVNRPYDNIEEFLWNDDGTWRHSKFNKKSLDSLIKIGAFGSFDMVGPDKVFVSYKQAHHVLVENNDQIKKTSKKDPHLGRKNFYELLRNSRDTGEWSMSEKAENYVDCFGSADVTALIDSKILAKFSEKGVRSIEEIEVGEKDICWFCIQGVVPKKTKNGKSYLFVNAVGLNGKPQRMNMWGWDNVRTFNAYTLCLAEVERNDFGHSTTMWKLKELNTEN
jgi:DNA polymerase-3 subunit alpha